MINVVSDAELRIERKQNENRFPFLFFASSRVENFILQAARKKLKTNFGGGWEKVSLLFIEPNIEPPYFSFSAVEMLEIMMELVSIGRKIKVAKYLIKDVSGESLSNLCELNKFSALSAGQ